MFDNFDVIRFRNGGVPIVIELENFPFRHFLTSLCKDLVNALATKLDDLAHGLGIQVVADKDADLISPNFSGGSLASAEIGVIDYIIMQQCRGVDEFDQTSQLVVLATAIPAESGAQKKQKGSDAFPAAGEDMGGDGIDEGDARCQVATDLNLNSIQLLAIGFPHVRHAVDR